MAPVHALDGYYLGITLLVTVGYQLLGFAIAWTFQVRSLHFVETWVHLTLDWPIHSLTRSPISLGVSLCCSRFIIDMVSLGEAMVSCPFSTCSVYLH